MNNKSKAFDEKVVLITGGTGSFGRAFAHWLLTACKPKKVIIFSRDEWKQSEMAKEFNFQNIRFFIGDVRDKDRLNRAFRDVDIVIHAAALKQVPTLEYNPFEAVLTNIVGAENVISAALDQGVENVVALSTDKAVNPVNLYGATKLCAEKLFVAANSYSGTSGTKFSIVRYGNVINSRGSVIPLFLSQKASGVLTITDPRMTRFWITLDKAVQLVNQALTDMRGGEIFVPKVPTMNVIDLAEAIAPDCDRKTIGIRPGEKLHEVLITEDEAARAYDFGDHYIIFPAFNFRGDSVTSRFGVKNAKKLSENFVYASNSAENQLSIEEMRGLLSEQADCIVTKVV